MESTSPPPPFRHSLELFHSEERAQALSLQDLSGALGVGFFSTRSPRRENGVEVRVWPPVLNKALHAMMGSGQLSPVSGECVYVACGTPGAHAWSRAASSHQHVLEPELPTPWLGLTQWLLVGWHPIGFEHVHAIGRLQRFPDATSGTCTQISEFFERNFRYIFRKAGDLKPKSLCLALHEEIFWPLFDAWAKSKGVTLDKPMVLFHLAYFLLEESCHHSISVCFSSESFLSDVQNAIRQVPWNGVRAQVWVKI